jgi:hypothetical protein
VAPTGDPDTGIYFPAANQVAVTTGGTQALLLSGGAVSNPTFSGVASFPDGSATDPSITNTGDTNTGVFFPAADTVGIATGGTERVRVNASGFVGIGTTGPVANIHISGDGSQSQIVQSSENPSIHQFRRVNNTQASPSAVAMPNFLGLIQFRGYDGATDRAFADMAGVVSGTVTAGTATPGGLIFRVVPPGSITMTERMRLDSNGLITGTGTSLGAWTSYTPTIGGTGWALGSATVAAAYCQIGKVVHVRCRVVFAADSTFGASDLPTLSLPVTPNSAQNNGNFKLSGSAFDASLTAFYDISARFSSGVVAFRTNASPEASITATVPFTWTTSDQLSFSGTYEAS